MEEGNTRTDSGATGVMRPNPCANNPTLDPATPDHQTTLLLVNSAWAEHHPQRPAAWDVLLHRDEASLRA